MQKLILAWLGAVIAALAAANSTGAKNAPQVSVTVIRAGTLIDGKSGEPKKNQVIVIRGNRIESVQDAASAKIPSGAKTIDLSGATVLPGLIDSHTHIFLWGEDPAKGGYDDNILHAGIALRAARATVAVRSALEQCFTTLRDLETEGAGYGDVEIKQAIEDGVIPGRRLFVVTPPIPTPRLRFDRARPGARRRRNRADGPPGHVVLRDDHALLQLVGEGKHPRRTARPQARRRARPVVHESASRRREDCLRHRCRQFSLERIDRAGIRKDGGVRNVADAGHPVRHHARCGNARPAGRTWRGRAGGLCGPGGCVRRSAQRRKRTQAREIRDERRHGLQERSSLTDAGYGSTRTPFQNATRSLMLRAATLGSG